MPVATGVWEVPLSSTPTTAKRLLHFEKYHINPCTNCLKYLTVLRAMTAADTSVVVDGVTALQRRRRRSCYPPPHRQKTILHRAATTNRLPLTTLLLNSEGNSLHPDDSPSFLLAAALLA